MKSIASVAALAVLIGPSAACAVKAKVDQPAPPFRVTTVTKDKLDLAALRGKVVVVNRWATWCVPCQKEFALFDAYAALRAKYGFTVIAIETGGAGSSGPMRKLAEMVHFPVVLEGGAHADAYPTIGDAVPTNYVIDRAGVVRYAKAGAFETDELDALVRPLLNEPAPPDPTSAAAPAK
jgi:cytochrome c biogenesis protein CcmG/thiol:disulfide interchange protein DsbE